MISFQLAGLLILSLLSKSGGFYLPGVAPHTFVDGETVELKVNKLSSTHTQLPFDYYSLKFCKPRGGVKPYSENLGEFLRGDRIENSPYQITMMKKEFCRTLCQVNLGSTDLRDFKNAIRRSYHHNWIIDNLPAASIMDTDKTVTTEYIGFPVEENGHRIVGFYVEPFSIKHHYRNEWDGKGDPPALATCAQDQYITYETAGTEHQKAVTGPLIFTYGIKFEESEVTWASRWDVYLSMNHAVPDKVMTDEEKAEEKEESGWKLVHADVFRPPSQYPLLFCVLIGTGTQVPVGFLSPANRGSLMIGMLLLFVLMGFFAGFASARLYKTFKGKQWQRCTVLTATIYPGICFATFFLLDMLVWSYGSTGAVPLLSMFAILLLWFGISVPLVFLGAFFGYKEEPITFPVITSNIPRQIPTQPWYLQTLVTCLAGGILPFGACFVELFFVMSSIWMDQYYYVFGFLLLVYVILGVTCAEVSMVLCYFQLCSEDYNWWWRSILTAGSTAVPLASIPVYSLTTIFTATSK
eukprot:gene8975-18573_t